MDFAMPQLELKPYATPFVSTFRPAIELPTGVQFGADEIHETGIANFEDFSTVGITDGLEIYLPLNENTIRNLANTNYTISLVGTPVYQGDSYYMNNANITTSFNGLPDWNTPFTLSIAIKVPASHVYSGAQTAIIGRGSYSGSVGIALSSETTFNFYLRTNASGNSAGFGSFLRDQWYYLTATWDGIQTMKSYKNGILETTTTVGTKTGIPDQSSWRITPSMAFAGFSGGYLEAYINNAKIFNRALTAEEIKIEYNTQFNNEVQIHESGVVYATDLEQY
jgi:hypothetical protein